MPGGCKCGGDADRDAKDGPRQQRVDEDLDRGRDGLPHGVEVLQEQAGDDADGRGRDPAPCAIPSPRRAPLRWRSGGLGAMMRAMGRT